MFKKILIANRGEIACRIIRTAKRLGIQCVAVYSEIDANALHVKMADEAYLIGPAPSRDSYLKMDTIIEIAKRSGAEAIHPGYGFLSENSEFAQKCQQANICFIGPPPTAINAMGSKTNAKEIMSKANVPVTPGYYGTSQTLATFKQEAKKIGYPIMLKAAAGGGGKGMRLVNKADELEASLMSAKREAKASFGDEQMFIEKYLSNCRHIEVQIFGDSHGNYVYLFERDCSIQRRHQKIIEEAAAPKINAALRQQLGKIAIAAAKAINYTNAGTIEFLLDENQQFYFMEMNTRLQVEHPITEMITGQDLVEWQLRIASGEKLPLSQDHLNINGHAFETRIYAEDPDKNFLPSIGNLQYLQTPQQNQYVRIDTGVEQGDNINVYYDPMIAKLIVWDKNRQAACKRLYQALCDYHIVGVKTNIDFLKKIIQSSEFIAEKISTQFLDKHDAVFTSILTPKPNEIFAIAALFILLKQQEDTQDVVATDTSSPWFFRDNWRLNTLENQLIQFIDNDNRINIFAFSSGQNYLLKFADETFHVKGVLKGEKLQATINEQLSSATIIPHQHELHIFTNDQHHILKLHDPSATALQPSELISHLVAPMPGTVTAILTKPGHKVLKGEGLMVIEAMKMEHTITAPTDGTIETIYFQAGDLVEEGKELLKLQPTITPT